MHPAGQRAKTSSCDGHQDQQDDRQIPILEAGGFESPDVRHFTQSLSMTVRKIIHVDMDAFFASVEQRDDPALRGLAVAVGGERERSVVAAASYEARRFGVRSAMSSVTAKRLCPDLVFVSPRFEVYREVSSRIRQIFLEYTPLVEPLSLDEAYLDVTENRMGIELARDVANELRRRIKEETGLTASAGVSYCKFLAKMASDMRKPDGLYVIPPSKGKDYVSSLPVGKFHGIGPATAEKMIGLGILTGADMERHGEEFLVANFGKAGAYFHRLSKGIDDRPVNPDRTRKSIGAENTFDRDLIDRVDTGAATAEIAAKVWQRSERLGLGGRTVTLKIKFEDFEEITRSKTAATAHTASSLAETAQNLMSGVYPLSKGIRLIGVTLSGLSDGNDVADTAQLSLFG